MRPAPLSPTQHKLVPTRPFPDRLAACRDQFPAGGERQQLLVYPVETPVVDLPSAAIRDILDRGDLDDWLPLGELRQINWVRSWQHR